MLPIVPQQTRRDKDGFALSTYCVGLHLIVCIPVMVCLKGSIWALLGHFFFGPFFFRWGYVFIDCF